MSQNPYQKMAQDYLELWQQQVSSVMRDKQFITAMLDTLQTMQSGYGKTTGKSTASNASASSDDEHGQLAQLTFRLAMCERRIAELEAICAAKPAAAGRAGKSSGRSRTRPRKDPA